MVAIDSDETTQKHQRPEETIEVSSSYLLCSEVIERSTLKHCPKQEAD